jgi:acyl dehydratase
VVTMRVEVYRQDDTLVCAFDRTVLSERHPE